MANTDKNIVITPNIGQTGDPVLAFTAANTTVGAQTIFANVYPNSNCTISFEGSAGQLFSITNSLNGTLFSVNDVSGIPSIEVLSTGLIKLAQYNGNVGIGTSAAYSLLDVNGNAGFRRNISVAGVLDAGVLDANVYGFFGQNVLVNGTNTSISTTTGALVLGGGAGIGGNINVGGTRNTLTGYVGIGTSTISNQLGVYGTDYVLFNNRPGAAARQEIVVGNVVSYGAVLGYDPSIGQSIGYLRRGDSAATIPAISWAYVSSNYRVGVNGITQPQNAMDIAGAVAIGSGYSGFGVMTNTNGLSVQGSVGIATFTPGSTLDVNGIISARTAFSTAGAATVASLVSNGTISTATADTATAASHYYVETASDGIIRPKTLANARTEIVTTAAVNSAAATTVGTITSGVWNAGAVTSSGVVTGTRLVSTIATGTAPFTITSTTVSANLNADLLDGLHLNTSGRANLANEVVRTDASGYIQCGWINTTSGDNGTTAIDRVYASSDGYIRYYTPANFRTVAGVPTNGNLGAVDFNTATISGMYRFDIPSANSPGISYGQLLVMHGASDTITQIAGDYATSRLFTRSGNPSNVGGAGSWGAWRTLIDTVGGQTISGTLGVSSTLTLGASISFSLANPNITASSYITMSGGLYVSGGLLYSQVNIRARGGISNDSATSLSITGGTSSITNVTGTLNATGEITAYSSDLRLKDDIRLIADPIGKISQLRGVIFTWKQDAVDHKVVQQIGNDVGVIAQEVQAVLPEAVKIAPFDANDDGTSKSGENYLTVQYEKLTALLIEAVKEQQATIDGLLARVAKLESAGDAS